MSAYLLIEILVIALAILASAWTVLGSVAPGLRARLLQQLPGHPSAPPPKTGCGSGCSSCDSCSSAPPAREQPIRFQAPH